MRGAGLRGEHDVIMNHVSVSNLETFIKYLDSTDSDMDMDIGNWGFRGVGSDKYE